MPDYDLSFDYELLLAKLQEKKLTHLKIRKRSPHLALYIEYDGVKQNSCRFTHLSGLEYGLSMADPNGRWEETPFTGTLEELLDLVVESFPWMISPLDI